MALINRAVRSALRVGVRRGVLGGERLWLGIGAAAVAVRIAQRVFGADKPIVVSEKLAPGETLIVRHLPPPST